MRLSSHLKPIIKWSYVKQVVNQPLARFSYVFIILIPILVKFTNKLDKPLVIIVNSIKYEFDTQLPFNWYLFFFGALFFTLGRIAFSLGCPYPITSYQDYGDFQSKGKSDIEIKSMRKKFTPNSRFQLNEFELPYTRDERVIDNTNHKINTIGNDGKKTTTFGKTKKVFGNNINFKYENERMNVFNGLYQEIDVIKTPLILTILFFYVCGAASFIFVAIENIIFVLSFLLE